VRRELRLGAEREPERAGERAESAHDLGKARVARVPDDAHARGRMPAPRGAQGGAVWAQPATASLAWCVPASARTRSAIPAASRPHCASCRARDAA